MHGVSSAALGVDGVPTGEPILELDTRSLLRTSTTRHSAEEAKQRAETPTCPQPISTNRPATHISGQPRFATKHRQQASETSLRTRPKLNVIAERPLPIERPLRATTTTPSKNVTS